MVSSYTPKRGDIVWLNFSPQVGHEQAGMRPALVLSPERYNKKSGLMIACPITSKVKDYPFEVPISANKIKGSILADQMRNIDWNARKASYIETVPSHSLSQTQTLIELLISN
jgi:mRNA interferase MazF